VVTTEVDETSIRAQARAWVRANWDPDSSLVGWRTCLVDSGWAVPSWSPRWFGRGLPAWADHVIADELRAAGAVGLPLGGGVTLAAPTLLKHGSDELNDRILKRTLTGELTWCQLFSEPGAGSDLASLSATAELDGEEWVVNGQKVWNTSAHHADLGMLLVRTDWDAPKHRGITYLVLPMRQPGVEVRPIVQMNRHRSFNEVFLTDARVPVANVVGEPGRGWDVARTTLANERGFATMRRPSFGTRRGRAVEEAEAEAADHFATYVWYPQRAGRADLLMPRARERGRAGDPDVRDRLAEVASFRSANEWTALRARANRELGRQPGPEGSLGKLAASELARRSARAHSRIAGAQGMLTGTDDPEHAVVAEVLVSTPAQSIAGGTDEIQKNIVGERVLGLPREPTDDPDRPFRHTPR
jgi:alkylation response protein AidB-like acyl-CoA dehydrogenase